MCKVPYYGKTYFANALDIFLKFNHVVMIGSFLINLMRENKLPLKMKLMKTRSYVMHHLII